MHRRLTYANVAATLALVLAMSGGAFAAGRYLINSTRQINPKVLRQLRGASGARGLRGATGAPGSEGKPGSAGTAGKEGSAGLPGSASLATAFVQMSLSAISLESTANLVLSTKEGKTLTLPGTGAHVLVQATVQLEASGVSGAEVTCHLAVAALPAGAPVAFGEPSTVQISASGFKVNQVALTGNVSLVGGATYDPQVYCMKEGLAAVTVKSGSLNAVGYE
jgi:hypothetical protein